MNDVNACSAVLLEYLFSDEVCKDWSRDMHFLQQVSNIPFVPTVDTPEISWLISGTHSANELVKLNGAAHESVKVLLWSLKPIVQLPNSIQIHDYTKAKMLTNTV